jgi:hypothetical protein
MEQGHDDPGGFLTAEIVRRKEGDQYGDEDRRDPIEEASPFGMPLIHESFPSGTVIPRGLADRASNTHEAQIRDFRNVVAVSNEFALLAQLLKRCAGGLLPAA